MKKYRSLLPLLFSLVLTLPLFGQSAQFEGKIIESLEINIENPEPGKTHNLEQIRARLKTKKGEIFSQSDFDQDLKTLAIEYARVEPVLQHNGDKIRIGIQLYLKPIIRSIQWKGAHKISPRKLIKEFSIKEGTLLDRAKWNEAVRQLKTFYIKQGFFEADISTTSQNIEGTNEIDIVITVCEGRAGRIKQLCFNNFTSEEQTEISEMIVTKKYNLFLSWMMGGGTYHEEAIQQDQLIILNHIQNKGYLDARVDIDVIEAKESNRIIVTITAIKGQKYSIDSISLKGHTLFSGEELSRHLKIRPNTPYSPEALQESAKNLMLFYGSHGYIDALVQFESHLDVENKSYSVEFTIEEGKKFRVGLIHIFGNRITQNRIILHESLLAPGEVFDQGKLEATEIRLKNIGFFCNVNVYAVASNCPWDKEGEFRDVYIEVEESHTGNLSASLGLSTQEGIFGGFDFSERNFNICGISEIGRKGPCALRGAGEFLHFSATIGAKATSYVLSWTKPYFMDTPWIIGFDIEHSKANYISDDLDTYSDSFNAHATYLFSPFYRAGYHYRLTYSHTDVNSSAFKSAKKENKSEQAIQLLKNIEERSLISAVGTSLTYDTTNHPLRPTCGFNSRFQWEVAGVGGDFAFFSVGWLNQYYIPINEAGVFKIRADWKFVNPIGNTNYKNLPYDERLFLGGINTIRGYRPYRLGPKINDDPTGGLSLQMYSLEYAHIFHPLVEGFAFFDAGFLDKTTWTFDGLWTSAGIGARLFILPGQPPITLGFGFPIEHKRHKSTERKKFFFNIGGKF